MFVPSVARPRFCIFKCIFVCFASLAELLRVLGAHACTEPVYALQQVAVLPVHRRASAPETVCPVSVLGPAPAAEDRVRPASRPASEKLRFASSERTRHEIYMI